MFALFKRKAKEVKVTQGDPLDIPEYLARSRGGVLPEWLRSTPQLKAEGRRNQRKRDAHPTYPGMAKPKTWSSEAEAIARALLKQRSEKDKEKLEKLREQHGK
jgi:hypothetical protein